MRRLRISGLVLEGQHGDRQPGVCAVGFGGGTRSACGQPNRQQPHRAEPEHQPWRALRWSGKTSGRHAGDSNFPRLIIKEKGRLLPRLRNSRDKSIMDRRPSFRPESRN